MHILLTDVLTCPRCGPEFGLILLADRIENRRVLEGWLGCANCRERFRVEQGFADLRFGALDPHVHGEESSSAADALKIAALFGITEGPGLLLMTGPGAAHAAVIADLIPGLEIIAVWAPLAAEPERAGISRLTAAHVLPIRNASMRGVALTAPRTDAEIVEAARVVAYRARVVIASGTSQVAEQLTQHGLRVLAQDESTTVAERVSF
jgi:uncharacterized protein YbaR (Trm112 family)